MQHKDYMAIALEEARKAFFLGEVPVGAVLVKDGEILAKTHNRKERDADPTAHAEVLALREGAKVLNDWRLDGCTLYVTLEPCPMCAGALVQARVKTLVYGANDLKGGAVESLMNLVQHPRLNHRLEVIAGICEEECRSLLKEFFQSRR
ncbi:MAG: tRNA adenosine(34) deaminase TadA [Clostridia bacterium]|nr:tRNA adenosine(34) deaminase TadA [Clostridia bacterium]